MSSQDAAIILVIVLLLIVCLGLGAALVYLFIRYRTFQSKIATLVQVEVNKYKKQEVAVVQNQAKAFYSAQTQEQMSLWRETILNEETKRIRQEVLEERSAWAKNQLDTWMLDKEQLIRKDAIEKSKSVNLGRMTEHFALFMNGMEFNPKDARFLGHPVDFVVFDGLDEGDLRRILFIEVKTGKSQMNTRERMVRDAVKNKMIEWVELKFAGTNGDEAKG